jgi:NAD(P)-dependent dehydrogenase (short-subunit alcohol dehydrogenase family)
MMDLSGKVAVVTGAASGIGKSISKALLCRGVQVALVDVDAAALERTRQELARAGQVRAYVADVTSQASLTDAAQLIQQDFGALHLAFNNAGVEFSGTTVTDMSQRDWDWVMGVNFAGVLNGVRAFLPRLLAHGQRGRIVNTASVSGFFSLSPAMGMGAYSASKHAVVALTEALEGELAGSPIGVTLLVPGLVATRIATSGRNRPHDFGGPSDRVVPALREAVEAGMNADAVGHLVLKAIDDDQFYVFTHADTQARLTERLKRIAQAFEWRAAAMGEPSATTGNAH